MGCINLVGVENVWAEMSSKMLGGGQRTREHKPNITACMMSDKSTASVSSALNRWRSDCPRLAMTGTHLKVFGGRPVWPLAFHQLLGVSDCRVFVEQHMAGVDFMPVPIGPGFRGMEIYDDVVSGHAVNWSEHGMWSSKVDGALPSLGLLHMKVNCVIPEEYRAIMCWR